jgi:zinc protease
LPGEHLELGLRLEADRLINLKLDDDSFLPELQVVISERKLRSVDSPFGLLEEQLFAAAYTQHPYQWPVIGWDQDLKRMTLDDCLQYYRSHYHPGNMTIVIAGDVQPEAALDLVAKYFGDIPNPGLPDAPEVKEPPQRGERRAVLKKVSQVEALFAGFHAVGMDHPDLYPLNLLSLILSGGKSSRFYQEFVRPGAAVDVEAAMSAPPFAGQDPDLLVIAAVAAPGRPLTELEAALWAAVDRLREEGVTPEELARAKKLMRAQAARSLANNFFRGLLVGLFHLKTGDAGRVNRLLQFYEQVTLEDITRVARQYLREDNRTVVVLQPVSAEESQALGPLQ